MRPLYPLLLTLCLAATANASDNDLISVKATPVLMKQIKVMAVGESQVHDTLRLPARIDLDQQRVARIGATVTGRINEIQAVLGQEVRKGEQLATLNSTELGQAQSDYLKTNSQVNLRRMAVQRAKRLLASDVIAAAELQERESLLNEAEVDLRTAADQLRAFGMSDRDLARLVKEQKIHSMLPITATILGTIVEHKVTVGQVVQPSDALFTVADLSHVWIVAEIPEQQAGWARKGDEARASIAALPGEELSGRLTYVADMVDPQTRTVNVRMALPNPQRIFKPNMLATLVIYKQDTQDLVLPDSAVLRVNDKDHVFVETGADEFQLRPVKMGLRYDNVRRVISGLKPGDRIVVEGAFHLNSERQRKDME